MSEPKFTPGPWTLDTKNVLMTQVEGADRKGLALVAGRAADERTANAALIATAPDMYRALEALVQSWEATADGCNAVRHNDGDVINVRALLSKARGES